MLITKAVSSTLQAKAVKTAAYVLNRTLWKQVHRTRWRTKNWSAVASRKLNTRACSGGQDVPKVETKRFNVKSKKMIFVGYGEKSTNYRPWDAKRKIHVNRAVVFNESCVKSEPTVETWKMTQVRLVSAKLQYQCRWWGCLEDEEVVLVQSNDARVGFQLRQNSYVRGKSRSMNERSSLAIRNVINGQNILMLAFILLSDVREIDVLIRRD